MGSLRAAWRTPAAARASCSSRFLVAPCHCSARRSCRTRSAQFDLLELASAPPSADHPFGTDQLSRDVLSRVVSGAGSRSPWPRSPSACRSRSARGVGLVAGYFGGSGRRRAHAAGRCSAGGAPPLPPAAGARRARTGAARGRSSSSSARPAGSPPAGSCERETLRLREESLRARRRGARRVAAADYLPASAAEHRGPAPRRGDARASAT